MLLQQLRHLKRHHAERSCRGDAPISDFEHGPGRNIARRRARSQPCVTLASPLSRPPSTSWAELHGESAASYGVAKPANRT